jgi:hypothetical protein
LKIIWMILSSFSFSWYIPRITSTSKFQAQKEN